MALISRNAAACNCRQLLCMIDDELGAKVAFLARPGVLAPGEAPTLRETHMSWIFLTKEKVFKLKKPVRFSFVDFSTLERREWACKEEVRLNLKLAPSVYLRTARLTLSDGAFELDGDGPVRDWLVVMRRLDERFMLDARIKTGDIAAPAIASLGELLIAFYVQAPSANIHPGEYVERFRQQVAADRGVLCLRHLTADHAKATRLLDRLEANLRALEPVLRARAIQGHVREGHGDLRPEHVWLGDPIYAIDRLEFDPALRLVDPFDELGYLSMECAVLGAPWIGHSLLERARLTLAPPSDALLSLYVALRASLRARLSLAHLLDPHPRDPAKWAPQTERYLAQAEAALKVRHQATS